MTLNFLILTFLGAVNGGGGDEVCQTTCFKSVAVCQLSSKNMKKKSGDIEEKMLWQATHWNLTYTPDEKLKVVFDLENVGGCGHCNPKRERAKHNGNCPCCEECERCLNHQLQSSEGKADYNTCCHCVGLCEKNDSRRKNIKSEEVIRFDFASHDSERFMDVTDEAIETHDLLHFDVLNESNKPMKTTGKSDLRRAYFHMCMDGADCSTSCQAMGAGSAKWIKAKINDKGCCECMDPRMNTSELQRIFKKSAQCKNCPVE